MKTPQIEICVDNLESLLTAHSFPIQRIELCSALAVGGITPNYGLLKQALALSSLPLAVMIRPRAGDFLYSEAEIQMMLADIDMVRSLGGQHIVIGALTAQAEIDIPTVQRLIEAAQGLTITFHRAFDLCRDPLIALENIIELGCDYLLTSGQAANALEGKRLLKKLVQHAEQRIQIMAGCGITAENVAEIVRETQVPQIHFSAKGFRPSQMQSTSAASMGSGGSAQDSQIEITDREKVAQILAQLKGINDETP